MSSYGGHWAPLISEYFLEQNAKNISGAAPINLEGVLIGNGWYDPLIQYEAFYNFSVFPGNTYDYDPLNQTVKGGSLRKPAFVWHDVFCSLSSLMQA